MDIVGLVFAVIVSISFPSGETRTYNLGDTRSEAMCRALVGEFRDTLSYAKLSDFDCVKAYNL